jgi:dTDP-D-glucose 4,6-dehydratase
MKEEHDASCLQSLSSSSDSFFNFTSLREGIMRTVQWFIENKDNDNNIRKGDNKDRK